MKRIIKTAVAVAVCGLAAAVAVPAQADNSIRVSGSGIVESFGVTGKTAGVHNFAPFTERVSVRSKMLGAGDAAGSGVLLNGQDVPTAPQTGDIDIEGPSEEGVYHFIERALGLSPKDLGISPSELYDATTRKNPVKQPVTDVGNLLDTVKDIYSDSDAREEMKSAEDEHMTDALRLAPVVREAAPAEVAPIADSLPGVVGAATLDEVAPLVDATTDVVDNNTHRSANSAGELQGAVTESIAQTNDLVAQH
ncbi:hypothetical protein [Nonomuraea recticatena]|uniref:Uncharacterized protein n=1 Tax=Nonomuraea recticatena TaxID=46178 RepID=A0ABN3T5C9_9ACTN